MLFCKGSKGRSDTTPVDELIGFLVLRSTRILPVSTRITHGRSTLHSLAQFYFPCSIPIAKCFIPAPDFVYLVRPRNHLTVVLPWLQQVGRSVCYFLGWCTRNPPRLPPMYLNVVETSILHLGRVGFRAKISGLSVIVVFGWLRDVRVVMSNVFPPSRHC